MNALPLTAPRHRRKSRILILSATLFRRRGDTQWRLSIIHAGKRSEFTETGMVNEAAAREFALLKIRELTRPRAQSNP